MRYETFLPRIAQPKIVKNLKLTISKRHIELLIHIFQAASNKGLQGNMSSISITNHLNSLFCR